MSVKNFHILMQNGSLYKNVKVLMENGYATSNTEVYWFLTERGYITILSDIKKEPIKLKKSDIYYFCASDRYSSVYYID